METTVDLIDDLLLETQDNQLLDSWDYADEDEYDWNADIPVAIKEAAANICTEYEGFVLTSIAHVADSAVYIAWYNDTTLDTEDDGYTMFREFRYVDGKAIDIHK